MTQKISFPIFLILILTLYSCSSKIDTFNNNVKSEEYKTKIDTVQETSEPKITIKSDISLGIDELESRNFDILLNKRIGLITNQTGVNKNLISTIDILNQAPNVNLVALFGPEHGVRGDVEGGKYVKFYTDKKTNLPVYSLYGKTRKPTEQMLKNIDILVYDIQDIGTRSYTFISTMGLAIEAASENNIDFVVLDRPNPLGGVKIEGNIVEDDFTSFIGQYKIPYVYGLTCGELTKFLIGEKLIKIEKDFNLTVIPMGNWERSQVWEDTKLEWIPTSPHIPHSFSPYYYPMTGILGELRSAISIGVGYTLPFQLVGAEWIEAEKLVMELENMDIPGLIFRPITFKPYYAFGTGKTLYGVQIHIKDYKKVNLTKTQFYILFALKKLYPDKDLFEIASKNEINMFNKGMGTDKIKNIYENNGFLDEIFTILDKDISNFKLTSKKYYLYK